MSEAPMPREALAAYTGGSLMLGSDRDVRDTAAAPRAVAVVGWCWHGRR